MKSFHFDCGDSSDGPIGFCARVTADDEAKALQLLRDALPLDLKVGIEDRPEGAPGVEYIQVYFNAANITTKDIDEVNDE